MLGIDAQAASSTANCAKRALVAAIRMAQENPDFVPAALLNFESSGSQLRTDQIDVNRTVWVGPQTALPEGYYAQPGAGVPGFQDYSQAQAETLGWLGMHAGYQAYVNEGLLKADGNRDISPLQIFFRGYVSKKENTIQVVQFKPRPRVYTPEEFGYLPEALRPSTKFRAPEITGNSRFVFEHLPGTEAATLPFLDDLHPEDRERALQMLAQFDNAAEDTRFFLSGSLTLEERAAFMQDKLRVLSNYLVSQKPQKFALIMTAHDTDHEGLIGTGYGAKEIGRFKLKDEKGEAVVYAIDPVEFIRNRTESADRQLKNIRFDSTDPRDPEVARRLDGRTILQLPLPDQQHQIHIRVVYRNGHLGLHAELSDLNGHVRAEGPANLEFVLVKNAFTAWVQKPYPLFGGGGVGDNVGSFDGVRIHLSTSFDDPAYSKFEAADTLPIFDGNLRVETESGFHLGPDPGYSGKARAQFFAGAPLTSPQVDTVVYEPTSRYQSTDIPVQNALLFSRHNHFRFHPVKGQEPETRINGAAWGPPYLPGYFFTGPGAAARGTNLSLHDGLIRPDPFFRDRPLPSNQYWGDMRSYLHIDGVPPLALTPEVVKRMKLMVPDIDWTKLLDELSAHK